jgi:broad specificity phosphatase PhoE
VSRGERTITTIRHSTTAHNASKIISGRLDEPLSAEGVALARELRAIHGELTADVVVTSPMRRAVETALLVTTAAESELIASDLCLERDYGKLQGIPAEAVQGYADQIDYLEVGGIRHSLNPPGGESFESVRERATAFLDLLLAMPARSIAVVSHQVFLQQFHGLLLGMAIHDALALDIRTLQVDRFVIDAAAPTRHEAVHPGMGAHVSW